MAAITFATDHSLELTDGLVRLRPHQPDDADALYAAARESIEDPADGGMAKGCGLNQFDDLRWAQARL